MPERPTLYELLETVRRENNEAHARMWDRISMLEKREYARTRVERFIHAGLTLAVGIIGVIAGVFLTGGK
jgi:hypothetical protein